MSFHRTFPGHTLLWLSVAILAGCGSNVETSRPLVDPDHGADILVEEHLLSHPRSIDQNRLLRGWRFLKQPRGRRPVPQGKESIVEFVNLEGRPRRLTVDLGGRNPGEMARVRARLGHRELGRFPISERVEIDLPDDLPLGRVAVALEFSDTDEIAIESVSISPNLTGGEVDIAENRIEQKGWSVVEVVRRVEVGARFVAEFQPPEPAQTGQRFMVRVEDSLGGMRNAFTWESSTRADNPDPMRISVPLVNEPGPVRISLVAQGQGPAGRWVKARIVEEKPRAASHGRRPVEEPPRLVVLYVMDALRSDHVGHLGRHRDLTPVLDELATEGVSFANHFAVAPNTPPSTRALFSGLCLLDDRQLPSPGPTRLAETFRTAGYRTVSIVGNPHLSPELDLGTGFESVELIRVRESHEPNGPPTVNNSAEILHEAALDWIDGLEATDRGFLYIHSMNPHNPYTPPRRFEDRFAPIGPSAIDGRTRTLVAIRDLERRVNDQDITRLRKLYSAGVAYNDAELGKLLSEISRRIDPRKVLLVVTSDHGEELFEHDGVLHGHTLYDEMLRIPLILRWPGRLETQRVRSLTNTLDLHASLAELAGGPTSGSGGSSLWPTVTGSRTAAQPARLTFAAAPGLAGAIMARSDRWKLIFAPRNGPQRGQGKGPGRSWDLEYVFDLGSDPGEMDNLAGTTELEVAWLRTRLLGWLDTQRALQPSPGDRVMDDETKDQLEALGYVVDH